MDKSSVFLETFEWDNVWWEHTENKEAKRIAYIGDSISYGTRRNITFLSNNTILCDGFATSKALDNPYFVPNLELFFKQMNRCDAILFNNGLHGWHLSLDEYEKHYDDMLSFLTKINKNVFVLLTTDELGNKEHGRIAVERNKVAAKLAKKYGLHVIDQHTISINNKDLYHPDQVHFTKEGYELLAKNILKEITLYL